MAAPPPAGAPPPLPTPTDGEVAASQARPSSGGVALKPDEPPVSSRGSQRSSQSLHKGVSFGQVLRELQTLQERLQQVHDAEILRVRSELPHSQSHPPSQNTVEPPQYLTQKLELDDAELLVSSKPSASSGRNSMTHRQVSNDGRVATASLLATAKMISTGLADQARDDTDLDSVDQRFELRSAYVMEQSKLLKIKKKTMSMPGTVASGQGGLGSELHAPERQFFHEGQAVERERLYCILRPSSRPRLGWDVLALLVLTYDLFTVPLQVFHFEPTAEFVQLALQIAFTLYWLMDIPASFVTAVYVNNSLLLRHRDIAKAYLQSWLVFDVLILVPDIYVIISSATEADGPATEAEGFGMARAFRTGRLLRLLRFLRLLRLVKLMKVLKLLADKVNNALFLLALRILKYGFMTVYGVHVLACLWFAAGDVENGWVTLEGLQSMPSSLQYLRSVEWTLSRVHPSSMQSNMALSTSEERGVAIFASFLALGFSSFFISSITNTMAEIERRRQRKNSLLQSVREYCSSHHISASHAMSIKSYVEREHSRKKTLQAHLELLETLPPDMLRELFHEARSQSLQHHELFDELGRRDPPMEMDLCTKAMNEHYILVSDSIIKPEQVAVAMYILSTGQCTYTFQSTRAEKVPRAQNARRGSRRGSRGSLSPGLMDFFGIGQRNQVEVLEACVQQELVIAPGDCVSEHTLWIEGWTHRGIMECVVDGWLLDLHAEATHKVLADHPGTFVEMVLYARNFVETLNLQFDNGYTVSDMTFAGCNDDQASKSVKLSLFPAVGTAGEAFAAT